MAGNELYCKYCGEINIGYRDKGPHKQAYCISCGKHLMFVKKSEEMFLGEEKATTAQREYLRSLISEIDLTLLGAQKIIEILLQHKMQGKLK